MRLKKLKRGNPSGLPLPMYRGGNLNARHHAAPEAAHADLHHPEARNDPSPDLPEKVPPHGQSYHPHPHPTSATHQAHPLTPPMKALRPHPHRSPSSAPMAAAVVAGFSSPHLHSHHPFSSAVHPVAQAATPPHSAHHPHPRPASTATPPPFESHAPSACGRDPDPISTQ